MGSGIRKAEVFLRLFSMALLISAASLAGLDTQTKLIFSTLKRKATVKDLDSLLVLVVVEAVAAGYNLLQLSKWFILARVKGNQAGFNTNLGWFCLLLDQMVAYVSFGATSAAAQASSLAVTGASPFEWLKQCNLYRRFCIQIGGSLACGFIASLLMAVISSISAFNLFRLYSAKEFLAIKPK